MTSLPRADLEARPGMVVALRLALRNRMMAAALVRPTIDDWVASDGEILPASARVEPAYAYLLQGSEVRLTVTLARAVASGRRARSSPVRCVSRASARRPFRSR